MICMSHSYGFGRRSERIVPCRTFRKKMLICLAFVIISLGALVPSAAAFVLDSASFRVQENGNADVTIEFRLEGIIENAIPDSVLESELKKGLTTDPANPPVLKSFSRSRIVLLMPSYASVETTENGTRYATAALNFSKAEIALKNSALNYLVSADFTPATVTIEFPDGHTEKLTDVAYLPSRSHKVVSEQTTAPQTSPASTETVPATTAPPETEQPVQSPVETQSSGLPGWLVIPALSGSALLSLIRRSG